MRQLFVSACLAATLLPAMGSSGMCAQVEERERLALPSSLKLLNQPKPLFSEASLEFDLLTHLKHREPLFLFSAVHTSLLKPVTIPTTKWIAITGALRYKLNAQLAYAKTLGGIYRYDLNERLFYLQQPALLLEEDRLRAPKLLQMMWPQLL